MRPGKLDPLFFLGLFMLVAGQVLHNFLHARYAEFAGGFLIGVSLVFMIAGFESRFRNVS